MTTELVQRPSDSDSTSNKKNALQAFLSMRPVQVALLVIFGAATLAIALFGQHIKPFHISEEGPHTLAAEDDSSETIVGSETRPADTVGGVASRDVRATHTFEYIQLQDSDIGQRRDEAWKTVLPIWTYDETVMFGLYQPIRRAFARARLSVCNEAVGQIETADRAADDDGEALSEQEIQALQDEHRTAISACRRSGLDDKQLSDKKRVELICSDRIRDNVREILQITELDKKHCAAFAKAGLTNEIRSALSNHVEDLMFQHIVEDETTLATLRRTVDPSLSSNARGFELRKKGFEADEQGENDYNSEIILNIDGYLPLQDARRAAREPIDDRLSEKWSDAEAAAIRAVAAELLRPNTFYDEKSTVEARQAAAGRKFNQHETTTYRRGQALLFEGDTITQEDAEIINQMNVTAPRIVKPIWQVITLALLLLIITLTIRSVSSEQKTEWSTRDITMMGLVLLLHIALLRAGFEISKHWYVDNKPLAAAAVLATLPYGAGALVVKSLTSSRNAFAFTAIASVLVAAMSGYDITWFGVSLIAGVFGAASLRALEKRSSVVRASALASVASAALIAAFGASGLIYQGGPLILVIVAAAFGAFLLTALMALALPTLIEFTFRYTTRSTLAELNSDDHPLRRKLQQAPGTLAHSLAVANLSADACKAIGANALLARVGATFHDIGKLRAPGYFGENLPVHNPHDDLTARESARHIIAHVADGVEEARKAGLPNEVIDFIRMHHGTMLVRHFYNVTCNLEGTENVDPKDFQYPGPLPNTKETGICLMVDGIEAMVRAMPDQSPEKIAEVVKAKIKDSRDEGQLIDSGLTLREIQIVEDSLIKSLCNMYHRRPVYAKAPEENADDVQPTPSTGGPHSDMIHGTPTPSTDPEHSQ